MKIITMQRLMMDGMPVVYDTANENGEDYEDWWCVIETPEEEMVYDEYLEHPDQYEFLWNAMVKHAGLGVGLSWGDDDLYGYIRPDETIPELRETYKDSDGDIWVRKD